MDRRVKRIKPWRNPKATSPAPVLTPGKVWKDRLSIAAWLAFPMAAAVLIVVLNDKSQWDRSIDDRLASWKSAYQIDSATIVRFREIEMQFHGSGTPFTTPIDHNKEEIKIHHEQMAALMDKEKGAAFLHDMQNGRWSH